MREGHFGIFLVQTHGVLSVVAPMLVDKFFDVKQSLIEHPLVLANDPLSHQQYYLCKANQIVSQRGKRGTPSEKAFSTKF